jgi:hypothetical protein
MPQLMRKYLWRNIPELRSKEEVLWGKLPFMEL